MQKTSFISIALIISLLAQGCGSTIYLKPTEAGPSPEVHGEILKNEGGILYVDDGDTVVEIPNQYIEDIDHDATPVAIAGGIIALLGLVTIGVASTMDNYGDASNDAISMAMFGVLGLVVGLPVGIGGAIGYGRANSAARESVVQPTSLDELSVADTIRRPQRQRMGCHDQILNS